MNNQMVSAEKHATDGGTLQSKATYVYDVFGQRIEKDVWNGTSTTVSRFSYDRGQIWADLDGSNAVQTQYLRGDNGGLLARVSAAGIVTGWYQPDRLGSVRNLTDVNGNVIDTLTYDAWGNTVSESNSANGDRFKYTGGEFDSETSLYRFGRRYYVTTLGVFTSEDPLGFAAGDMNLSRYVFDAPTLYVDPSGMQGIGVNGGGGAQGGNADQRLRYAQRRRKHGGEDGLPADERFNNEGGKKQLDAIAHPDYNEDGEGIEPPERRRGPNGWGERRKIPVIYKYEPLDLPDPEPTRRGGFFWWYYPPNPPIIFPPIFGGGNPGGPSGGKGQNGGPPLPPSPLPPLPPLPPVPPLPVPPPVPPPPNPQPPGPPTPGGGDDTGGGGTGLGGGKPGSGPSGYGGTPWDPDAQTGRVKSMGRGLHGGLGGKFGQIPPKNDPDLQRFLETRSDRKFRISEKYYPMKLDLRNFTIGEMAKVMKAFFDAAQRIHKAYWVVKYYWPELERDYKMASGPGIEVPFEDPKFKALAANRDRYEAQLTRLFSNLTNEDKNITVNRTDETHPDKNPAYSRTPFGIGTSINTRRDFWDLTDERMGFWIVHELARYTFDLADDSKYQDSHGQGVQQWDDMIQWLDKRFDMMDAKGMIIRDGLPKW